MLLTLSDMSKVNTWVQAVPFGYAFTLTQITAGIFIVVMEAPTHFCELVLSNSLCQNDSVIPLPHMPKSAQ